MYACLGHRRRSGAGSRARLSVRFVAVVAGSRLVDVVVTVVLLIIIRVLYPYTAPHPPTQKSRQNIRPRLVTADRDHPHPFTPAVPVRPYSISGPRPGCLAISWSQDTASSSSVATSSDGNNINYQRAIRYCILSIIIINIESCHSDLGCESVYNIFIDDKLITAHIQTTAEQRPSEWVSVCVC